MQSQQPFVDNDQTSSATPQDLLLHITMADLLQTCRGTKALIGAVANVAVESFQIPNELLVML